MTDPLRNIAEFRSSEFSPFLPEESQVNPEVYGAELAYWLAAQLAAKGIVTSYPEYEDWGWYIEYLPISGSEFAVHCYNVDGARDRWLLALRRPPRKLFGRDLPAYSEAAPLIEAIQEIVHNTPSISQLQWLYSAADETS